MQDKVIEREVEAEGGEPRALCYSSPGIVQPTFRTRYLKTKKQGLSLLIESSHGTPWHR